MEEDFRVNYVKNKVDVVNYLSIDHFENNKIMIRYKEGLLVVIGSDLTISKLLKDEVLISGVIKEIEFR